MHFDFFCVLCRSQQSTLGDSCADGYGDGVGSDHDDCDDDDLNCVSDDDDDDGR